MVLTKKYEPIWKVIKTSRNVVHQSDFFVKIKLNKGQRRKGIYNSAYINTTSVVKLSLLLNFMWRSWTLKTQTQQNNILKT